MKLSDLQDLYRYVGARLLAEAEVGDELRRWLAEELDRFLAAGLAPEQAIAEIRADLPRIAAVTADATNRMTRTALDPNAPSKLQ